MSNKTNQDDVNCLKKLFAAAWQVVLSSTPEENIYAAGFYTNEIGQYMFPFVLGEVGLTRAATRYIEKGIYTAEAATENLRWSTADSPYSKLLSSTIHEFEGRSEIYDLAPTAAARESRYRLTAARDALRELDSEGFFGHGDARQNITLYIEGGDVNREWILNWAKQVNPKPVYERFSRIGAEVDTCGSFTEFGTKKVYETTGYAQSGDLRFVAAATQYQLVMFDTASLKQLYACALPSKEDYCSLGDVAMSADGTLIAVIPFGGGRHECSLFIVGGKKGDDIRTIELPARPMAVAVEPRGYWILATDMAGSLHQISSEGRLLNSVEGHSAWPRGLAISPDSSSVVTADSTNVVIWNTSDWSKRHMIPVQADGISFDPSGQTVVCACRYTKRGLDEPKAARIIDVRTGAVVQEIAADGYRVHIAKFSPDGRMLACAVREDKDGYAGTNTALLIDLKLGAIRGRLKADFKQIRDFAFLPHRNEIAVAVFGHTRRPLVLWQQPGATD